MGWLLCLAVLLMVGALPIGVFWEYRHGAAGLYAQLGPVRIPIRGKREKKTQAKAGRSFESHETAKKKGSDRRVSDYFPLMKPVLKFLVDFRKKLRVSDLRLKIVLAGDDPCDLSLNYGRAWAAVGNLMPLMDRFLVIKNREISIECDYAGSHTTVDAAIRLTVTVARLLQIVLYHGISILREYYKILKQAKDGAVS